jgi:hypothetical protein
MAIKIAGTEVINDNRELVLAKLTEIDATIADTAVDIFVYDTRKDSDGGAWRKRTQHTSWYNETLNTATRGSRREFPAVAVIVAESNKVTIYDGDDPDLPMWMVFTMGSGVSYHIGFDNRPVSSIASLDGTLLVGLGHVSGYLNEIHFAEDASYSWTTSGKSRYTTDIANRNSTATDRVTLSTAGIVNRYINDVAMTVLPNAPIDAATGLPVPTIAVATNGGVSVIKDDGTVVDITTTYNTNNTSDYIDFTSDNRLYFCSRGKNYPIVADIPSSDISSVQSSDVIFWPSAAGTTSGLDQVTVNNTNVTDIAATTDNSISFGGPKGIIYAQDVENISADKTAVFAQITSDFNTGYQNGDIKLATLSDTDDTNVTGSELVTNGSMEANNSWEAVGTPTASGQTSAQAHSGTYSWYFTGDGNYDGIQSSVDFSITSGKAYVVDAWVYPVNDTGITLKFGGVNRTVTGLTQGAWNQVTETIVSTQTTTAGTIGFNTDVSWGGGTWYIDDVSVRLAEPDRSVNGNGLQVFGTVTKSAVATGADLVAYSGFSASNYLEQPYNSDLDFGTGDFCYQFWESHSQDLTNNTWLISWDRNSPSAWVLIGTVSTTGQMRFEVASSNYVDVTSPFNMWNCWHFVRRSGVCYVYLNGKQQTSFTSTDNLNASARSAGLSIGKIDYTGSNDYWRGSVALIRISATAPSPEQIKKIYEDEKRLFQEGAQATLYGSSDAVTALAYDDNTELLHVGTSAGRSVFQGLRRVDNTTTAVGAAISASNGLVADE